jgi:hypothetical protein
MDGNTLEVADKFSGEKWHYYTPSKIPKQKRQYSQVFDLTNIDTTLYEQKYSYWKSIPIGAHYEYPMVCTDFDNDGLIELTGEKIRDTPPIYAVVAIYEMQPDSSWILQKQYENLTIHPVGDKPIDLDGDGLMELMISESTAQSVRNYEASQPNGFPDSLMFQFNLLYGAGEQSHEVLADMDRDSLAEIIYYGQDGQDQVVPPIPKLIVAEYKQNFNNFQKLFGLIPSSFIPSICVSDLDQDMKYECIAGAGTGQRYFVENDGDDNYWLANVDTLAFWNPYLCAVTNDLDQNGKPELFMGGYNFINGHQVDWYEADADNHLAVKESFLIAGTGLFAINHLQAVDIDGDAVQELIFTFENYVLILKYIGSRMFEIYYVKSQFEPSVRFIGTTLVNIVGSTVPEVFISKRYYNTNPTCIRTKIYRLNEITSIKEPEPLIDNLALIQNYPNPFNSQTKISFSLSRKEMINLSIYNITGKEVINPIHNQQKNPGKYEVTWDGKNNTGKEVSSGVYIYVLLVGSKKYVKKMILIR